MNRHKMTKQERIQMLLSRPRDERPVEKVSRVIELNNGPGSRKVLLSLPRVRFLEEKEA